MALIIHAIESGSSLEEAKIQANDEMGSSMKFFIDTIIPMHDNISTRTIELINEKSLRKEAEEALNSSEERWKFILEGIEESVWDGDIEEDKMHLSEKNISLFEIVGKRPNKNVKDSTIHPSDIEQVKADLQAHLDGRTEFYVNKHRVIRENGSWAWVLSRGKVVSRDENEKPLRMVGTHSDITERELASIIYKNISQAILICDVNKKIIAINPSFTDITGYKEKDAIGKNPSFMASGKHDKKFYQEMWNKINSDGYFSGEIYNKRKNGEIYLESMDLKLVTDSSAQIDHYVALFNDITEITEFKKEHERQKEFIFQQSKMAQMGEMISMIAHQWRQPLGAISSTSIDLSMQIEFEKYDLKKEDEREDFQTYINDGLNDINKLVQSLTTTIDDFRNFYRPNKEANIVYLTEPINRALDIMKGPLNSDGIKIVELCTKCDKKIKMFNNEMIQVILNILKNAQDNFKEKNISDPKITIKCSCDTVGSDAFILEILDNGGGISNDIIGSIFNPYFSTKGEKNGIGLGLYMSKTIVEEHHNGSLNVENRNDGTCFTIILNNDR